MRTKTKTKNWKKRWFRNNAEIFELCDYVQDLLALWAWGSVFNRDVGRGPSGSDLRGVSSGGDGPSEFRWQSRGEMRLQGGDRRRGLCMVKSLKNDNSSDYGQWRQTHAKGGGGSFFAFSEQDYAQTLRWRLINKKLPPHARLAGNLCRYH